MNEYRIVKNEVIKGKNEIDVSFIIQKKVLFFWVNYRFKIHNYTHKDWNEIPCLGAMLQNRVYRLNSIEEAKEYIEILQLDFKETYKGNKIGIIFTPYDLKIQYINWSCGRYVNGGGFCYEFSESLESLKDKIDERIITRKKSVVY